MANKDNRAESVFTVLGYKDTIAGLLEEIRALYREDDKPWIIGYSGGKDSTAVLQLVWSAIRTLDVSEREKPIYVISTDTLVENPVVAAWVNRSLISMADAATEQQMPVVPHRLTPELKDSFWVNLIGKGYPAPRPKFRWCTERLKINPSNAFITGVARKSGETILVLGTRKAESSARARNMAKHERLRTRDRLSPSSSLPNCLIFSPIEDWSNDDVWLFLMQTSNPWGYNNKDLLTMYQGASPDGECPLVVDATTPSCGDSRFGCWVCTMVDKDKSMHAMIQNDDEKEWMLPLLQLRNELDIGDDRHLRDFRRMNGLVQIFKGRNIPGPYTQKARERWVRRVLETETWIRQNAPESVRDIQLITDDELKEIRRIWVTEKHEIEDTLPQIYREVTGRDFPTDVVDEDLLFGKDEVETLREICGKDEMHFELTRELIAVAQRLRSQSRRSGIFDSLERTLRRNFYDDKEDAIQRALKHQGSIESAKNGDLQAVLFSEPADAK